MSNNDSIETSAASVEEAIKEALEQLGASEDDVAIEVLATPRAGVLGLGARAARVRVTRRPKNEASSGVQAPPPAPPLRRERREPEQPPRRVEPARSEMPRPAPVEIRENAAPPAAESEPRSPRESAPAADEDDSGRKSAEIAEQSDESIKILSRILELMGEKAELRALEADNESIELEIKGDGSGILIGRHGQTLDALEYLVNRILARHIKDAVPVSLEIESYRARRRQQLHRMALSMGERAKREHEPVKLEPMPPRDRRVIHMALKDDPMLTTRSAGDGFLRSIEIVPAEGRRDRERERGNEAGRGRGRRGRGNERSSERHDERNAPERQDRAQESKPEAIGEQGGFKHGQKRLF
jgi:spoIIIJ-associated protein